MNKLDTSRQILNLIRISDSFFPIGSFAVSQGMEEFINSGVLAKEDVTNMVKLYLTKVWETFDFKIFLTAEKAIEENNIDNLIDIDNICYVSKLNEETRLSLVKMGKALFNTLLYEEESFEKNSIYFLYKDKIAKGEAICTYPVALAIYAAVMKINKISIFALFYTNAMEVVASLVRMSFIDYLEAQHVLVEIINTFHMEDLSEGDFTQSFPALDVYSMKHEHNQSRMFIS